MVNYTLDQFFNKKYVKCVVSLSVQNLLFCSWFASSGFCASADLIVITPKEQTGAESIVYLAGTVTRSSSFTKPVLKTRLLQSRPPLVNLIIFNVWNNGRIKENYSDCTDYWWRHHQLKSFFPIFFLYLGAEGRNMGGVKKWSSLPHSYIWEGVSFLMPLPSNHCK